MWVRLLLFAASAGAFLGCSEPCKSAPPGAEIEVRSAPKAVRSLDVRLEYAGARFRRVYELGTELADGRTSLSVVFDPPPPNAGLVKLQVEAYAGKGGTGQRLAASAGQFKASSDACMQFALELAPGVLDGGVGDAAVSDAAPGDAAAPDADAGQALGPIAARCGVDGDCAMGLSCWAQTDPPFLAGGYCTLEGCLPACPADSTCAVFPNNVQGCMKNCDVDADCGAGAICEPIPPNGRVCFPHCNDDVVDCPVRDGSLFCNRTSGRCEAVTQRKSTARVGDACADSRDCALGMICIGEARWGVRGGACTRPCEGFDEAVACLAGETCQALGPISFCLRDCVENACPERPGASCTKLLPSWPVPSCIPQ